MKDNKEKDSIFLQDINANEEEYIYKLYHYFYSLYKDKKEYKSFIKCFLIFIETIQFISYAFSSLHHNSWKIDLMHMKLISKIVEGFRLSILMQFLDYKLYCVILYLLVIFIFIISLIVVLQILFTNSSSKIYNFSLTFIRVILELNVIIFFIPISEIILIPTKCVNGVVQGVKNGENCVKGIYYLNVALGIVGEILFFSWCIFLINFSFYPFQKSMSTIRINSHNDIIILIMKLIAVLQYFLISNEYLSLAILLIISITMFFTCFKESTYNNDKLEYTITIKNSMIFWTYFVLLFSILFEKLIPNGFLYLLVFGYPIVIYLSIVLYKEKFLNNVYFSGNIRSLKDYIKKIKFNMNLIDFFIERNRNIRIGNENEGQRSLILLKGNVRLHNLVCTEKECSLKRFLHNEGNFNIQRQCLLNYMNNLFNKGLKKFPNNIYLLMLYVRFNYSKRFNLNSVKTNMILLKQLKCTIKERFIIFSMEQNIINNYDNGLEISLENNKDNDDQSDLNEQKFQNLKYLIENSIKLFGEFWGIFATNVTSNINTNKLYSLGKKLNIYIKEINNLWDELKNKKISKEHQSIVQLYSKFLLEILWDPKKSREVSKKLNDGNLNNNQSNENKKLREENNSCTANIEALVDNQDYILFCDSDEFGNCKMIQCSASFAFLLSYQKYDILGKSLELVIPNFLLEEFCKYIKDCIKVLHNGQKNQKEITYQGNDSNQITKLIIVKNRMGYIFPLYSSLRVLDDNDYSDSFLIKIKMEDKDNKSEYGYYILTNPGLTIENISSSAINLGLTLDLLKKYVIKINYLIRTDSDTDLNLFEDFVLYDEPKVVTWVFPHIIYPKDNDRQIKDDEVNDLIEKSKKKLFNLQIKPIKYNENDNLALVFKFTEISNKNNKQKLNNERYIPKCTHNLILFDLINLNYIRTLIVKQKSGFRNLRNFEEEKEKDIEEIKAFEAKKIKKRRKNLEIEEESSEESPNNDFKIELTKEKILELQVQNYPEIKNFIYSLPIYGTDVGLEKFRPNGEKYSAYKMTESLIRIQVNNFCKRVEEKLRLDQNFKRKKNKNISSNVSHINSPHTSNNDNYLMSPNESSLNNEPTHSSSIQGEEANKGLISDTSSTLANIFRANTIKYIKILNGLIFFGTFILILVDFLVIYKNLYELKKKINFFQNGYIILNDMLYTKYFITEAIITNIYQDYYPAVSINGLKGFFDEIKEELAFYRLEFSETYKTFTSDGLSKEFKNYIANTKIDLFTLTLNKKENLSLIFNSAMNRIPASLNDLTYNETKIKMDNRDTFELMYNLINDYYIKWYNIVVILYNDCIKETEMKISLLIIFLAYLLFSIIALIIFLKLLSKFSVDREKPINLFQTIKKQIFENLKNSAENFSNKLLNKFFGNEDNDDESQQDYQSNIQPNDINIVKFKAVNEYNSSIKNAFSFLNIIIIILAYIIINLFYFLVIYLDNQGRHQKVNQFILLLDKNNLAQSNFVLSLNVFKSYLFDKSIPILNRFDTKNEFYETFLDLTDKIEDSILFTSKTNSFLSMKYFEKYKGYLLLDFSDLLEKDYYERNKELLKQRTKNGIKPIVIRVFEIINYLIIKYCNSSQILTETDELSFILKENDFNLIDLNINLQHLVRRWYDKIIILLIDSFDDYHKSANFFFIVFFICFTVFSILYYSIVWKTYEEKLNYLLKGSEDLINLIPQEIKNLIIEKLN